MRSCRSAAVISSFKDPPHLLKQKELYVALVEVQQRDFCCCLFHKWFLSSMIISEYCSMTTLTRHKTLTSYVMFIEHNCVENLVVRCVLISSKIGLREHVWSLVKYYVEKLGRKVKFHDLWVDNSSSKIGQLSRVPRWLAALYYTTGSRNTSNSRSNVWSSRIFCKKKSLSGEKTKVKLEKLDTGENFWLAGKTFTVLLLMIMV